MSAGAFAVIFDDERSVLLCHRRDIDAWNLPGGRVEEGEALFTFECRVVSGAPGLSEEADRVGYFALDALPANTGRKHVERIRDALAGGPTVLRVQTGPGMRDLAGRT